MSTPLTEKTKALLIEIEQNAQKIMKLKARRAAHPIRMATLRAQVKGEKDQVPLWDRANRAAEKNYNQMLEFSAVMDESTKTLRECNELLKFFGSFKNPILEQKEATLKRLKEEWDEFKDKIEESAAAKENTTLKARAAELREMLTNVRAQKWALIREYNDMKKKAVEKENKVVVKFAAAKLENHAKQEELRTQMEKMALTESEHEKWKSNVEMKELELVELKKRYEKVSTEKNDFFAAKLDYIPMANVSYDEMEDKQLSPTGSEDSYADTSFSAGADGPQHNAGLFGLDNFFLGTRNQDNNGHRVTAGSNASIEQSRQSVLQENPNRLSINEAQVQSGNQSIRNADQRFPDGSLTRDARNCASVRQPDDLDETAKDDHNQGNDGRRSTYDSGTSKGQPRQSIFRENPNRMPTNGAKEQPAKQPLAKKQPTPSTAHRVIHKDDVSARKSVDLDDFTHGNRNDGRDNAGGTGSSTGQGSQANRKPNNGGNQQSVYQPSVNKQPNPSTFHQVANKGDAATYKPVEPDAFSHGNRNDDRRYASGAGGSAGQPNEGALQENGNRKAANGAKAQPAKKPPADPQSSTSSAVHRSVDARQKSFVAVRDIKQLREEPYRNRSPSQCSTLSFHSTVGIKRRQPPTEYNAGMARPEERPPQPKKMSPLIQSDAHTNQSFRMPSSSDNQVSRHMAASAQKPSVQKQNPPVFTGEGQPAQFDPKTLTSAEADSDSREQKANPSINDNEMRSESSDDWLNENGSAQSEPQKNDETNVSFDFVSDDEKKTMSQQTGHGSNEKPRKRNANDGDGLKKMDGNGEVKKNKTGAANEEFEVAADDFRFDDNSMNDFGFGNVDLLPDFNPAEFTSYNTAEYGEYKATDDSFRLDEPYNYANDDELQSPGVVVGSHDLLF